MSTLIELQQAREAGHLSAAEFQQQADRLHQQLFALVPALIKSEVHQILIDGDGLRFVMGDEAVALWCPAGMPRAAPLVALNEGAHEADETALINALAEGARAILCLGAGIGYGALRLAQREPKASVYAFEPRLARYEYLSRNVALNALGDRVRLFALALGREAGSLLLANADQAPMRVPTISLDDWGQQSGVQPDFIHCACAGRAVFEGARATLAQHRPRVFCALRDERSALVQLFSELGYRAWVVGEYGLREAGLLHPEEPAEYGVFLHPTAHGRLMDELTDSESACAGQADA